MCHFCLSCKAGTYSFNHLFQKWLAKICACCHFFLTKISSFTKDPGGKVWTGLCSNRWLGVKGSQSFGSSQARGSGLEFKIDLTSIRTVVNTSSSMRLFPRIAFRAVRVLRISLSQSPLASLLEQFILDLFLVPVFNGSCDLSFTTNKVRPILFD